jgi:hypothetical protein
MMTPLRCYTCGGPLADRFVLYSMSRGVDRFFTLHVECVSAIERIKGDVLIEVNHAVVHRDDPHT